MRLDNWQNNLAKLIETKRAEPFDFPNHNCLMWALEAIKAVNGNNYSEQYCGKYKTETQAAKLLRKIDNVKTSQSLLELKLGQKLQPIAFARMGDIVLASAHSEGLELPGDVRLFGSVPGVCNGPVSYFVGEHGLLEFQTLELAGALWVN